MANGNYTDPRDTLVAMPEGDLEDELTTQLLAEFQLHGFRVLDLRTRSPTEAIVALALPWPKRGGRHPRTESRTLAPAGWERVVIMGGSRFDKTFWKNLCDNSVLYDGAGFPPDATAPPCILVPDNAVVVAAITASSWRGYGQRDLFGPVCRFSQREWFGK